MLAIELPPEHCPPAGLVLACSSINSLAGGGVCRLHPVVVGFERAPCDWCVPPSVALMVCAQPTTPTSRVTTWSNYAWWTRFQGRPAGVKTLQLEIR
jgi:hypothetical protein